MLAGGTAATTLAAAGGLAHPVAAATASWAVAGAGTGLLYLDTLRRAVDAERSDDALPAAEAATAASTVEAVATALATSASAGVVGSALAADVAGRTIVVTALAACSLLAPLAALAARRAG
jgi:hypothetical protein